MKVKFLLESITKGTNFYEVCRGNRVLKLATLRYSKSSRRTLTRHSGNCFPLGEVY